MSTQPMPMVQVFAPDGTLGDIPYDRLHDALGQGAKIAAKVKAPDGTVGFVPGDRVSDALKAGGQRVALDLHDADGGKPGFWSNASSAAKSAVTGLLNGATTNPTDAAGQGVAQAQQMAVDDLSRQQEGRSKTYRVAAPIAQTIVPGLNPRAMEVAANQGDTAGVLGQAAVPALLAASPLAAEGGYRGAAAVLPSADAIGTALRTPEGKLIAPVKYGSKIAGMAAGHATGIPGMGELGGYLLGDKLADMAIPDRPGAMSAAERRAVAKQAAAPPKALAPIAGPAYPTPDQLAQGAKLSDLVGEKPSGITVLPEPRAGLPGDVNLMGSIPRGNLQDLALAGKPGAGAQLQYLGQPVLYAPSGAGISNLKSSVALRDLLSAPSKAADDFAYRVRNQGEEGVPIGGSKSNAAHATTTLEDAQRLAPGRGSVEGEPQEIVKYDLSKLKEGTDYERVHREGQPDWIRMLRPLKENEVQLVKPQ